MNKAKSILKRSIAILLAVLTLMSVGLTSVIALSIDMVETAASKELAATGANIKVYFKNNDNWPSVRIHAWNGSNGTTWPGKTMTDEGNGIWSAEIDSSLQNCLFNNVDDENEKTGDLTVQSGKIFDNGWTTYPPTYTTIYFDNTGNSWSPIYCYGYIDGQGGVNWPGVQMTLVEGESKVYSAEINTEWNRVIFNNGSGNQTGNLTIPTNGNNCYNSEETNWTTYTPPVVNPDAPSSLSFSVTSDVLTAVNDDGTSADKRANLPVGKQFSVTLDATTEASNVKWVVESSNTAWNTTIDNSTKQNTFDFTPSATGEGYIKFKAYSLEDGKYSDSSKDVTVYYSVYDYFRSGESVYFDFTQFTNFYTSKIYIRFSEDYDDKTEDRAEMTKIGDYLYKYTFQEDCYSRIRFWRENDSLSMNGTQVFSKTDGNGIYLPTGTNSYDRQGEPVTFSDFAISQPTLEVSPAEVVAGVGTVTLTSNAEHTLTYKAGSYNGSTKAIDVKYTFKVEDSVVEENITTNTSSYSPAETVSGTQKATVTVSTPHITNCKATSLETSFTVNPNKVTVTFVDKDGKTIGEPQTIDYNGDAIAPPAPDVEGYTFKNWDKEFTDVKSNIKVQAVYEANDQNFVVNVSNKTENDPTTPGSVTNNVEVVDGKVKYDTEVTLEAQPVDGYRFVEWQAIEGVTIPDKNKNNTTLSFTVKGDVKVTAVFEKIPEYKIYFSAEGVTGGTVTVKDTSGNSVNLNAVPYGTVVNVTAKANTGYTLGSLVIDGETITGATTQITVEDNVYITATWAEKTDVEFILRAPSSKGSATGTVDGKVVVDTNSSNAIPNKTDIEKNTTITLTAAGKTGANQTFDKWVIDGKYTIAEGDSLTDEEIVITVNGPTTATATFKTDKKYIYIYNGDTTHYPQLQVKAQDINDGAFFTVNDTVEIDGDNYYRVEIKESTGWINIRNAYTIANSWQDLDLNYNKNQSENCFFIKSSKTGEWGTVNEGGSVAAAYTIQTSDGKNSVQLEDYGDGLYVGSLTLEDIMSASAIVEASDGTKWGVKGTQPEGNSTPVQVGSNTYATILPESDSNTYMFDFTFDPKEGTLSWTVDEKPDTVTIYIYKGMGSLGTNKVLKNFWGKPTGDSPMTVEVKKGEYVTLQNIPNSEYKVEGWVVEGDRFIKAYPNDTNTVFTGDYKDFQDGDRVIPVYSHSDAWFTKNSEVKKIRVNFQKDELYVNIQGDKWGKWTAAYVWYANDYGQIGVGGYPGQLMIPKDNGEYYIDIESQSDDGDICNGVTFNNYQKLNVNDYEYPDTPIKDAGARHYQTYDYLDFATLYQKNYNTITYVLKAQNYERNDDGNVKKQITTTVGAVLDTSVLKTVNQVYYDMSLDAMDILRNGTTKTREEISTAINSTPPDNSIKPQYYIVRKGMQNYDGRGAFFVKCYFYDKDKKHIGSLWSHEIHDVAALKSKLGITDTTTSYLNQPVVVYYEGYNADSDSSKYSNRVDGEWFGIAADKMFKVDVQMGLQDKNGNMPTSFVKTGDYGTVRIDNNGLEANVKVNGKVDLQATTQGAHKFVGWYNTTKNVDGSVSLGTLISKNPNYTVENVAKSETYVAVFAPLGEGILNISHLTYKGSAGNSLAPIAHSNGSDATSNRFIKVEWVDENDNVIDPSKTMESRNEPLLVETQELDRLKITIRTEVIDEADWLFAWYTDSVDANNNNNYEEIGMTEEFTKDDRGVPKEFSFIYEVKAEEQTSSAKAAISQNITIYSDIVHPDMDVKLVYKYVNRFGKTVSYVKEYTLQNLEGFNERLENHPSPQTIADNAPYVDDLYKDAKWVVVSGEEYGVGSTFIIEAEHNDDFTVKVWRDGEYADTFTRKFNGVIELNAKNYGAKDNNGFWYEEKGKDNKYTQNEDLILGYGRYYGLRVVDDMTICYFTIPEGKSIVEYMGYQVVLDEAIYGREQTSDGSTSVDKIYIDYLVSLHLPYFFGDKVPNKDNEKFNDDFNADSPITMDTFVEQTDYVVDYGVMLQQVNPNNADELLKNDNLDIEGMKDLIRQGKGGVTENQDVYYSIYSSASKDVLTNKNRFMETFISGTTDKDKRRKYNVYAYLVVKDKETGEVIKDGENELLFISNRQTLNVEKYINENPNSNITEIK